tara:strand:- start:119 stop:538 length:420 start_codon:yes stop_codon:yes gene_type:complete
MSLPKLKNKGFRGYVFSRPIKGNLIPQKVQNLVIRDYALRKNLFFKLSAVEYSPQNSFLMLNLILKELNILKGLIFYSIFMLPEDKKKRENFFYSIIEKKKEVHFALEEIILRKKEDLTLIEDIFYIEKNKRKKIKILK